MTSDQYFQYAEPVLTHFLRGNFLAGRRAARDTVIRIDNCNDSPRFTIRMATSRGNPTYPIISCGWTAMGGKVVSSSKIALQALLAMFGVDWNFFLQAFVPDSPILKEVQLKEVIGAAVK